MPSLSYILDLFDIVEERFGQKESKNEVVEER